MSMYRDSETAACRPTVITYKPSTVGPRAIIIAILSFLLGLMMVACFHRTHLTCERATEGAGCSIRRYGLDGIDERIPARELDGLDVQIKPGSKGSLFAELRLRTTPGSGRPDIELETGLDAQWAHIEPAQAFEVQRRFAAYLEDPSVAAFDEGLEPGQLSMFATLIVGAAFMVWSLTNLREQLQRVRAVRLVVDHARGLVILGKREIPVAEIAKVEVRAGRAFWWSSRKVERAMAHRIVVVRHAGDAVPATKEFRTGPVEAHEIARKALLATIASKPAA